MLDTYTNLQCHRATLHCHENTGSPGENRTLYSSIERRSSKDVGKCHPLHHFLYHVYRVLFTTIVHICRAPSFLVHDLRAIYKPIHSHGASLRCHGSTCIHLHTHGYTYIRLHSHGYAHIAIHGSTCIHLHTLEDTYIHLHSHGYAYTSLNTRGASFRSRGHTCKCLLIYLTLL